MNETTCPSCGAPYIGDAAFCSRCGAPRTGALATSPPAAVAGPVDKHFVFTGGALGLFGRVIAFGFGLFLIVPAPWIVCWFYRWLVGKIEGRYGTRLSFHGTPGSVWVLTTLYGLLFLSGIAWGRFTGSNGEPNVWAEVGFQIANNLASIVIGYFFFRWMIGSTAVDGSRLTLTAGLGKYVGWMVLVMLATLTIIGWAWVACAMYRWLSGTVEGAPGRFTFTARGHQLLGRTLLYLLFCVPIVTIPWAIRWYLVWYVEQFRLEEGAQGA